MGRIEVLEAAHWPIASFSVLRGNQANLARALTAERTDFKPTSPFNWALAARALDGAGDAMAAERARQRLTRLSA